MLDVAHFYPPYPLELMATDTLKAVVFPACLTVA